MSRKLYHEIHFTVAEAIQQLYIYHPVIEKMQALTKELISQGYSQAQLSATQNRSMIRSSREYGQLLQVIHSLQLAGILVKGAEEGLVDFPHVRENGEEVYLCFRLGEPTIQYWHRVDAGFSGRQPLNEL